MCSSEGARLFVDNEAYNSITTTTALHFFIAVNIDNYGVYAFCERQLAESFVSPASNPERSHPHTDTSVLSFLYFRALRLHCDA